MAATDTLPRFFKVFISHFSSDSMLIPISYYNELPSRLPKTALLQGTGGCSWNVAMIKKRDEVHFGKGWAKFVKDNSLTDGDFMTFVYNGDRVFEVSIYGPDGCKEVRAVAEVEDEEEEDSIWSLSSADTDTILRNKDKGKSKVESVEESDDEEDSDTDTDTDTETDSCSDFKMAKPIRRSRNKGKKKVAEGSAEDSDSGYVEAFDGLDFEGNFTGESSYASDSEDSATCVKPKKKGESRMKKAKPKIENPEAYLDDPKNVYFEAAVKNRIFELLVHAQLVKDYSLEFQKKIEYIDNHGKLVARTSKWGDKRVCIKRWSHICERNELKVGDRILCELFRKGGLVYAVKLHIVREKDL